MRNRQLARERLLEAIRRRAAEERQAKRATASKIRRRNSPRPARLKRRILESKRKRSQLKNCGQNRSIRLFLGSWRRSSEWESSARVGRGSMRTPFEPTTAPSSTELLSRTENDELSSGKRFHPEKHSLSYEDLLHDPEIDTVIICLPNFLHFPATLAAWKQASTSFAKSRPQRTAPK